jgi:Flp pilus assembly protein TadG
MLFPAGILAVVVLAAVAVDASVAFLGERELSAAVTAAANDAATEAVSNQAFYQRGSVELDDAQVEQVAVARVRTSVDTSRYQGLTVQAQVIRPRGAGCAWSLRVEASASVRYVFATALPGGPDEAHVSVAATASPEQGNTAC